MKLLRQGFTLIELLVVMSIMVILGAMLFALVTVGDSAQQKGETQALIAKVGTAIGQFKHLTGSVPLPTGSQANPLSGTWYPGQNNGSWEKQQLWWRLSKEMTVQVRKDLRAAGKAADLIADPYQSEDYMKSQYASSGARAAAIQSILNNVDNGLMEQYVVKKTSKWLSGPGGDVSSSGYLSVRGLYKSWYLNIRGTIQKDLEERKYLTMDCLDDTELGGDQFLKGFTVLDAWGNPLIYVAHSTVEVEGRSYGSVSYYRSIECPPSGRVHISDRNNDGIIDKADWNHAPPANELRDHNGDGSTDVDDWGSILWNARPGNGLGYYLASAGSDQLFNCLFADEVNDDNIINNLDGDS